MIEQQKKIIPGLCASSELPFIKSKKSEQQYCRKNKKKSRTEKKTKKMQYNVLQNKSDRLKLQYIKIFKQIKKNNLCQANNIMQRQNKLVFIEKNNGKPQIFNKFSPIKKIATQPAHYDHQDPFIQAIQCLQNQKSRLYSEFPAKISSISKFHPYYKPTKLSRGNKIQTQYLNIGGIPIHSLDQRNSVLSNRKINNNNHSAFQYQNDDNKIITSIKRSQLDISNFKSLQKLKVNLVDEENSTNPQTRHSNFTVQKSSQKNSLSPIKKRTALVIKKKFNPLFQTYFYRDLLWRVNLSNQMIIDAPLQYEHRLRVYIGKGNNSGLVRGLIKRRIWFAITDRMDEANFVWLQLKNLAYYNCQRLWEDKLQTIQNSLKHLNILDKGLYNEKQSSNWVQYFENHTKIEERQDQKLAYRTKYFLNLFSAPKTEQQPQTTKNTLKIRTHLKSVSEIREQKMQNHFKNNYVIGNKKTLFKTMAVYYKNRDDCVFNYLPYTFHVKNGLEDQSYFKFLKFYYQRGKSIRAHNQATKSNLGNVWIVKPGEYSNRGYGIKVCKTLDQIKAQVKKKDKLTDGSYRTYIVQSYIQRPLLYNKRKFDLRHYMMITCVNGILKGYWYREGYVRTSAIQYSMNSKQSKIHLTNDAVQKNMAQYGKYEKGNKISYQDLHNYILKSFGFKNYNFKEMILPKMKKITTDIVKACSGSIDPGFHGNNFEIFGMDFMIDEDFNVWLIEVNTNPCLEISCPLLGSIIPKMIQNALELTLDTLYPPPIRYTPKGQHYTKNLTEQNKFDLIYDSRIHGINRESTDVIDQNLLKQEDEEFEDDGQEWDQQD